MFGAHPIAVTSSDINLYHCYWTLGMVIIRSASTLISSNWIEMPPSLSSASINLVLSLYPYLPGIFITTLQWLPWAHTLATTDAGNWVPGTFSFHNGWQALSQEMENFLNPQRDQDAKYIPNIHCNPQAVCCIPATNFLSLESHGKSEVHWIRKRFYQLSEIKERNMTQGS